MTCSSVLIAMVAASPSLATLSPNWGLPFDSCSGQRHWRMSECPKAQEGTITEVSYASQRHAHPGTRLNCCVLSEVGAASGQATESKALPARQLVLLPSPWGYFWASCQFNKEEERFMKQLPQPSPASNRWSLACPLIHEKWIHSVMCGQSEMCKSLSTNGNIVWVTRKALQELGYDLLYQFIHLIHFSRMESVGEWKLVCNSNLHYA